MSQQEDKQMNAELMPVQFYGDTVFLVEHNEEPYVPAKPIVDNIGLDWSAQYSKLKSNSKRWGIGMIPIPSLGGTQEMVCMPLRKLPAFLFSIDPRRVKSELRSKIEMYQEECDKALWDYWTKGEAINPRTYKSHDGKLPSPGLSMDAISKLCREVEKSFKGKVALRTLHYFTGMPVDDLMEEIDDSLVIGIKEDLLTGFLENCCELDSRALTQSSELYRAFCTWHEQNSDKKTPSHKAWGKQMGKRFSRRKSNGISIYEGIRLA